MTKPKRAELRRALFAGELDHLIQAEERQQRARMAAHHLHLRVMRARLTAGDIRGR